MSSSPIILKTDLSSKVGTDDIFTKRVFDDSRKAWYMKEVLKLYNLLAQGSEEIVKVESVDSMGNSLA